MISTSDFKRGLWIEHEGEPWQIQDVVRQSPSARGAALIVKAKLKNARTNLVQEVSFRGGDKVAEPNVEQRPIQFLFRDGDGFHFMDRETFDQFALGADELAEAAGYLTDDLELTALMLDGAPIGVELPAHVDLEVVECPPPIKTGGSGSTTKPATLATGLVIQVPPYLEQGEVVRVDTRDGRFVSRAR